MYVNRKIIILSSTESTLGTISMRCLPEENGKGYDCFWWVCTILSLNWFPLHFSLAFLPCHIFTITAGSALYSVFCGRKPREIWFSDKVWSCGKCSLSNHVVMLKLFSLACILSRNKGLWYSWSHYVKRDFALLQVDSWWFFGMERCMCGPMVPPLE